MKLYNYESLSEKSNCLCPLLRIIHNLMQYCPNQQEVLKQHSPQNLVNSGCTEVKNKHLDLCHFELKGHWLLLTQQHHLQLSAIRIISGREICKNDNIDCTIWNVGSDIILSLIYIIPVLSILF